MTIPFKTPKVQMAVALFLILVSGLFRSFLLPEFFMPVVLILILTLGFDYLFLKFRQVKLFFLSAAVVSGLIIALLLDPKLPFYELLAVSVLAMFSKNFIRVNSEQSSSLSKHIFNPAGFGLFLGGLIFQHNVSWWAVSYQVLRIDNLTGIILFLILLSPAYISMYRIRRWRIALSFLLIYAPLVSIIRSSFNLETLLSILIDPTTLFFTLVMLPEPMTSPYLPKWQIGYGIVVAVLSTLISLPVPDALIFGLLLGNLVFFGNGKFLNFKRAEIKGTS